MFLFCLKWNFRSSSERSFFYCHWKSYELSRLLELEVRASNKAMEHVTPDVIGYIMTSRSKSDLCKLSETLKLGNFVYFFKKFSLIFRSHLIITSHRTCWSDTWKPNEGFQKIGLFLHLQSISLRMQQTCQRESKKNIHTTILTKGIWLMVAVKDRSIQQKRLAAKLLVNHLS